MAKMIFELLEGPVTFWGILSLLAILFFAFCSNLLMTNSVDVELEGRNVWIGQIFDKKRRIDIHQVYVKNELSLSRRFSVTTVSYEINNKKKFGIILNSTSIFQRAQSSGKILKYAQWFFRNVSACLLYTSPSPRDQRGSRMPSSA